MTQQSLGLYLRALRRPLLDPRIFSEAGLGECIRLAEYLNPEAAFGNVGLEFRLGADAQCDILVCAVSDRGGQRWLSSLLLEQKRNSPEWDRLSSFVHEWTTEEGALHGRIDRIWLEFDGLTEGVRLKRSGLPVPSIFFSPRPAASSLQAAPDQDLLVPVALQALSGAEATSGIEQYAQGIADLLLGDSYIFQVGVLLGRASPLTRVCLFAPSVSEAMALLGTLPPLVRDARAMALLRQLEGQIRHVALHIDIAEAGFQPGVSLELYVNSPGEPIRKGEWVTTVKVLEALQLVTPAKARAIESYPRTASDVKSFPSHYYKMNALLSCHRSGVFAANIHHIKLSYRPGSEPVAKAYVVLWHQWD